MSAIRWYFARGLVLGLFVTVALSNPLGAGVVSAADLAATASRGDAKSALDARFNSFDTKEAPGVDSKRFLCPECDDEELAYELAFLAWMIWDFDLGVAYDDMFNCESEAQLLQVPFEEYCADEISTVAQVYAGWMAAYAFMAWCWDDFQECQFRWCTGQSCNAAEDRFGR